jgi:hypothetical protein
MREDKSKKKAYVPPVVTPKAEAPSLARIERELARIQKKLGMDFSWFKA